MQDVQIKLTAKHLVDGSWDASTHHYEGKRVQKAASWYITYKEQMEGAGEVSTTIKLSNKAITLIRQGGVSTRQQFERGKYAVLVPKSLWPFYHGDAYEQAAYPV